MQRELVTDCDGSVKHEKWQEPAGTLYGSYRVHHDDMVGLSEDGLDTVRTLSEDGWLWMTVCEGPILIHLNEHVCAWVATKSVNLEKSGILIHVGMQVWMGLVRMGDCG